MFTTKNHNPNVIAIVRDGNMLKHQEPFLPCQLPTAKACGLAKLEAAYLKSVAAA